MNTDLSVAGYSVYLVISIILTVWVARTLGRNGLLFIRDVLRGNEPLAEAVNKLLQVGFYLLNLGFIALWLQNGGTPSTVRAVFESVALKLGAVMLLLGVIHLANVFVLSRFRRRSIADDDLRNHALPAGAPGFGRRAAAVHVAEATGVPGTRSPDAPETPEGPVIRSATP